MADDDHPRGAIPSVSARAQEVKVAPSQPVGTPLAAASALIGSGVRGLAGLVKLEVVVTTICFFIPLIVWWGDDWNLREHISGYYAMEEAQLFYVPLTVAAMLFVVNGVVREKHWYNVGLGVALTGVVLFNHFDHSIIHNISAAAFFGGNALVFVLFTPKQELWFKVVLALTMALGLAGYLFGWYSLFVAESLSLWVIAVHFILESKRLIE